ncbi:MAG: hypothetical protein Q4A03_02310 [Rothia sp. (in: high G+C Gram-positive bacteria)]|uniref:hypothetical protein n=1 Tax=Rothia sp. (in: high G+C Gram-positive bacteria) TaxID=1885016 RepID=UPI002707C3D7|nr:hypothetical protein [Rothia sp. (in: high G+C Gram-positive bacteria)]
MDRRTALVGISGVGVLLALGGGTSANARGFRSSQKFMTRDQQFDLILSKLESLPEHLKEADPRTYPNYEKEIQRYIGDTTLLSPAENSTGVITPQFNAWACAGSLAGFIVNTGAPVAKIIGWIKRARQLWGGVRGIWRAIRSGAAAAEIGSEAASVLEDILGYGDVVNNCFS